jgi:hypothetical protein
MNGIKLNDMFSDLSPWSIMSQYSYQSLISVEDKCEESWDSDDSNLCFNVSQSGSFMY